MQETIPMQDGICLRTIWTSKGWGQGSTGIVESPCAEDGNGIEPYKQTTRHYGHRASRMKVATSVE